MSYRDGIKWWAKYLRVFALSLPWGITGKFTIGVPASVGHDVVRLLDLTPKEVVDAAGRPCFQVDIESNLVAIEWLKPEPAESCAPSGWGGVRPGALDPRDRYQRNASGALELKPKK